MNKQAVHQKIHELIVELTGTQQPSQKEVSEARKLVTLCLQDYATQYRARAELQLAFGAGFEGHPEFMKMYEFAAWSLQDDDKVGAIKHVRLTAGMSLVTAKFFVENLELFLI